MFLYDKKTIKLNNTNNLQSFGSDSPPSGIIPSKSLKKDANDSANLKNYLDS